MEGGREGGGREGGGGGWGGVEDGWIGGERRMWEWNGERGKTGDVGEQMLTVRSC